MTHTTSGPPVIRWWACRLTLITTTITIILWKFHSIVFYTNQFSLLSKTWEEVILFRCSSADLLNTGCNGNYLIVSFDSRPRQNAVQFKRCVLLFVFHPSGCFKHFIMYHSVFTSTLGMEYFVEGKEEIRIFGFFLVSLKILAGLL